MWLFNSKKEKKRSVRSINKNMVNINMTRSSVCMADDCNAPHKEVIGVDSNGSLRDLINILLQRYCPRINGGIAMWILSYNDKPLAVFNGGTGTMNILNDDTAKLSIYEIVKGNDNPHMFLHYIGQNVLEEAAKTMLRKDEL